MSRKIVYVALLGVASMIVGCRSNPAEQNKNPQAAQQQNPGAAPGENLDKNTGPNTPETTYGNNNAAQSNPPATGTGGAD